MRFASTLELRRLAKAGQIREAVISYRTGAPPGCTLHFELRDGARISYRFAPGDEVPDLLSAARARCIVAEIGLRNVRENMPVA